VYRLNGLEELELRILASLNEAGEEHVSALLNSVLKRVGKDSHLSRYIAALSRLYELDFIAFADSRGEDDLVWESLPDEESLEKLALLSSQLMWDQKLGLWVWNAEVPMPTILLTQRGATLSNDVLERFGWDMTEPM